MTRLVALVLAVLVGLIRGGHLARLGSLSIRRGELALGALIWQLLLIYGPWLAKSSTRDVAAGLMLLSYLPLFVFVWLNKDLPGLKLIGLGLALNFLVIGLNKGYMPISPEALARVDYDITIPSLSPGSYIAHTKNMVLAREETLLWILSDIFASPRILPWLFVFSIGDAITSIGVFVLIQKGMLASKSGSSSQSPRISHQPTAKG